ncbi:hypothetical protein BKA93DRAFT_69562 [Sparassis latifolia]
MNRASFYPSSADLLKFWPTLPAALDSALSPHHLPPLSSNEDASGIATSRACCCLQVHPLDRSHVSCFGVSFNTLLIYISQIPSQDQVACLSPTRPTDGSGKIPGGLMETEDLWRDSQKWFQERGAMLRPLFVLDWKPSW